MKCSMLEVSQLDLARLHLAVGGGAEYQTPIGSIRLALGVRLNRMADTLADGTRNPDPGARAIDRLAFHLTIGEAF